MSGIVLAPMEGVIDHIVRERLAHIGGLSRMTTEFVRVVQDVLPSAVFHRYCPELVSGSSVPVAVQLLGGDGDLLAANALKALSLGAPGIDLNFGCPAKTVNRHDGGAVILKSPLRLHKLIAQVVKAVAGARPVSVKIRLGFEDKSLTQELAQAVNEANPSSVTIHARTKIEMYRPPAHWSYIGQMKAHICAPVYANGDIWTVNDFERCQQESGVSTVALGRGLMANPWLALEIRGLEPEVHPHRRVQRVLQHWLQPLLMEYTRQRGANAIVTKSKQLLRFLGHGEPIFAELFERAKVIVEPAALLCLLNEFREYYHPYSLNQEEAQFGKREDLHLDGVPLLCASQGAPSTARHRI